MKNNLLLIGIDKYLYHPKLNNCVKDLHDFRDILFEKFHFDELYTTELFDETATNKNIQDAFLGLARTVAPEDNLIVYFSGHGNFDDSSNRGYWVPVEAPAHNYTQWISNDTLISLISSINCKHIFLISDSCFSNSLFIVGPTKGGFKDYSTYKSR
jgi:uncharacterized caspase-like protein